MEVTTDPYLWSGQDRMLTVEDRENMPDVPRSGPVPGHHRAVPPRRSPLTRGGGRLPGVVRIDTVFPQQGLEAGDPGPLPQ
jgi:hypothetical protein